MFSVEEKVMHVMDSPSIHNLVVHADGIIQNI